MGKDLSLFEVCINRYTEKDSISLVGMRASVFVDSTFISAPLMPQYNSRRLHWKLGLYNSFFPHSRFASLSAALMLL